MPNRSPVSNPVPNLARPTRGGADGDPRKWWICGLLLLATTLNYMDRMALNQTSVRISQFFSLSNADYGMLEGWFSFAFAIGALVMGFVVDRGNVRLLYPAMVLGWSIAGFATGLAETFSILLACRFMLGLFEAGNWPCAVWTVRRVLPAEQRSFGNGLFTSGTALGAIITPMIVLGCLAYADPFASARAALSSLVGGAAVEVYPTSPKAWQLPFLVIGAFGLGWIVLWFAVVRDRDIRRPVVAEVDGAKPTESFRVVLADRRFWLLLVMVLAINSPWHSLRVWLPKFLQQGRGYSESEMMAFSSVYYLFADFGSIAVGLATIRLARRMSVENARLIAFAVCSTLTLLTILVATLPKSPLLLGVLLLVSFGTLGLFPTYFAFSQDLSAKHQGKVTGTLGCLNALYLWLLFPLQGLLIDRTQSYGLGIAVSGALPLVSLAAMLAFWRAK